jgi:hypothetical protein
MQELVGRRVVACTNRRLGGRFVTAHVREVRNHGRFTVHVAGVGWVRAESVELEAPGAEERLRERLGL